MAGMDHYEKCGVRSLRWVNDRTVHVLGMNHYTDWGGTFLPHAENGTDGKHHDAVTAGGRDRLAEGVYRG